MKTELDRELGPLKCEQRGGGVHINANIHI